MPLWPGGVDGFCLRLWGLGTKQSGGIVCVPHSHAMGARAPRTGFDLPIVLSVVVATFGTLSAGKFKSVHNGIAQTVPGLFPGDMC